MNTSEALRRNILAYPHDKFHVLIFADWLQEFEGMSRFCALRVGAELRRFKLDENAVNHAAVFLRKGTATEEAILAVIEDGVGREIAGAYTLVLKKGKRPPFVTSQYRSNRGAWWYDHIIEVSAMWVLKTLGVAELVQADRS